MTRDDILAQAKVGGRVLAWLEITDVRDNSLTHALFASNLIGLKNENVVAIEPPPPTPEQRIAELEARIAELEQFKADSDEKVRVMRERINSPEVNQFLRDCDEEEENELEELKAKIKSYDRAIDQMHSEAKTARICRSELTELVASKNARIAELESATPLEALPAEKPTGRIEWGGGKCPVAYGVMVKAWYKDGRVIECRAGDLSWFNKFVANKIISYQVIP